MSLLAEPRRVAEHEFPIGAPRAEQLEYLLAFAVLAPSSRNTQPWRFVIAGDDVELRAEPGRWSSHADPGRREFFLSLGCALENLAIAAERFGFTADVALFPEPADLTWVATVRIAPTMALPVPWTPSLRAILERHTAHAAFAPREVTVDDIWALRQAVTGDDVRLDLVTEASWRRALAAMLEQADRELLHDAGVRADLAAQLATGALGPGGALGLLAGLAVKHLDLGPLVAPRDEALVTGAPLVGMLSVREEDPATWVRVGRLFERLWLTATDRGLGFQPVTAVIEVPALRRELGRLLPQEGWLPVEGFRIGHETSPPGQRSPRRAVEVTRDT